MPLDADDLEKITVVIERATGRLEKDISILMPRSEYEKGHIELSNRTVKNEQSIQEVVKWAMSEHKELAVKSEVRFNTLDMLLKEANKQIDEVKGLISSTQLTEEQRRNAEKNTTIRYIVSIIVGIIIGVTIPLLLKVIGG